MERSSTPSSARWETFAHGADVGVRGFGPTLAEAFEQAALALTGAVTSPERVAPTECVAITCEAPDRELCLYEWLNALIYEMDVRRMLFGRYEVELDREGRKLTGRAFGEPVDVGRHEPAVEVKGATLTALEVTGDGDRGWLAQCIVDV